MQIAKLLFEYSPVALINMPRKYVEMNSMECVYIWHVIHMHILYSFRGSRIHWKKLRAVWNCGILSILFVHSDDLLENKHTTQNALGCIFVCERRNVDKIDYSKYSTHKSESTADKIPKCSAKEIESHWNYAGIFLIAFRFSLRL